MNGLVKKAVRVDPNADKSKLVIKKKSEDEKKIKAAQEFKAQREEEVNKPVDSATNFGGINMDLNLLKLKQEDGASLPKEYFFNNANMNSKVNGYFPVILNIKPTTISQFVGSN